jgi:hypothetical protein
LKTFCPTKVTKDPFNRENWRKGKDWLSRFKGLVFEF